MTLIIGLRTKEGVVMGADRRLLIGLHESTDECKIFIAGLGNTIAVTTEGLTGLRDKFIARTQKEMEMKRTTNLSETVEVLEDIMREITMRYSERFPNSDNMANAFVVGLESLISGEAKLYSIQSNGYSEEVMNFGVLGEAGPFAKPLVKLIYTPSMTIEEAIDCCYFSIRTVEELDLIQSIGGTPDILICRNNERPTMLNQNEKDALSSKFDGQIEETKGAIKNFISKLTPQTSP